MKLVSSLRPVRFLLGRQIGPNYHKLAYTLDDKADLFFSLVILQRNGMGFFTPIFIAKERNTQLFMNMVTIINAKVVSRVLIIS